MINTKQLVMEFFNISEEELENKIKNNPENAKNEWLNKKSIDDFYKTTDTTIFGLAGFNSTERVFNLVYPLNRFTKKMKILDFGGGIGELSLYLSRIGHDVYYYDLKSLTQDFAKFLAKKTNTKVNFIDSFKDIFKHEFDMVITLDILEHLENPIEITEKLNTALKTGGFLFTSGLIFSVGEGVPMHLKSNLAKRDEFDAFINENFYMHFFNVTPQEVLFLLEKKGGLTK